jgi:DNA end-binding protein Ku
VLQEATISFGLVTVPVKLYPATRSLRPSFHWIHQTCGSRIREQLYCPKDGRVVSRDEVVRGYETGTDEYVTFTPEELRALESETTGTIDIEQFVPVAAVDPIYYEGANYLGPGRGGEKAYRLLADVMRDGRELALGRYVIRGKTSLVAIRALQDGLVLHTLYFAEEVRDFGAVAKGGAAPRTEEIKLARRLISELKVPTFRPGDFHDTYRERVERAVGDKAAGKPLPAAPTVGQGAVVVDLMDALRKSLERRSSGPTMSRRAGGGEAARRPPAARRAVRRRAG